jgi:hypothetical protein
MNILLYHVKKNWQLLLPAIIAVLILSGSASAQSAAFTYQGRLTDAGSPASGTYDIEFKLFDTVDVGTGTQQGTTITNPAVQVTNGTFTVALDFGPEVYDGSPRYLEIAIRPAGSPDAYTVLSPRQPLTSSPYALRSLASTAADGLSVACVNCVSSTQIASVEGAQITGEIPVASVPVGSDNYIQNAVAAARPGIKAPRAPQEGGFDLTGDGALGGNLTVGGQVGIGTATPEAGIKLDIIGNSRMSLPNGTMNFGTPNTETGMTVITSQVRADLRVNNSALKLVAGPTGFVPPAINGIVIDLAGNVGIGTETPQAGIKLDIVGNSRMTLANGTMNFGSPNSETGMTVINPQIRADLRLDGSALKLVAGPAGFIPPATNGVAILPNGNVGIGTSAPVTKLHVEGSGPTVESVIRNTTERAILVLDSSPAGQRGIWTLESGVFGTPGLFGIYDRTTNRPGLTIDASGLVAVKVLQITGGLDLAEHFDVAGDARPGMLVAIDPRNAGRLSIARGAYNRRVAGVISGANNLSAGMVLAGSSTAKSSQPVALTGRAWVYCDATRRPINPGDLLTTSSTPGHAMKVTNYQRAHGAIIGKAITGLKSGRGLVLALVSLQ